MRSLGLCFIIALSSFAMAEAPSSLAQTAHIEAVALMRAELWADAVASLDRAIAEAPGWEPPYLLRARCNSKVALSPALAAASETFDPKFDYVSAIQSVASINADYAKFVALAAAGSNELVGAKNDLEALTRLQDALKRADTELRAGTEVRVADERRKQELESRKVLERQAAQRQRAEEQAKAALASNSPPVAPRVAESRAASGGGTRTAGIVISVIGGVAAASSLPLYLASNAIIEDVRTGNVGSYSGSYPQADDAASLRTGATVLVTSGGVLLIVGLIVAIAGGDIADASKHVAFSISPSGASAQLSLSLP